MMLHSELMPYLRLLPARPEEANVTSNLMA